MGDGLPKNGLLPAGEWGWIRHAETDQGNFVSEDAFMKSERLFMTPFPALHHSIGRTPLFQIS
jgi:hypothetical protein